MSDAEVQEEFERALAHDAQVTAPELPAPPRRNVASDPDAPHGREDDGTPKVPFGTNKKTGKPNLRPPGPGRGNKGKADQPRTRDATPEDVRPPAGQGKKTTLEPVDYAGPLMEASEAIWFGGSIIAKVGPQVPLIGPLLFGKLLPPRKIAATCAVFDSERPRLCAALNLAAQHDQRARNLAVKLSAGEVSWALTCMFMVAPFAGAVGAIWQTSDKHDVLAERELPSLDDLANANAAALDRMLAKISEKMEAAQLAMAEAEMQDNGPSDGSTS